jgi:hypothetical protein
MACYLFKHRGNFASAYKFVWSIVCKSTITNMVTVRTCEFVSYKFSVVRICMEQIYICKL